MLYRCDPSECEIDLVENALSSLLTKGRLAREGQDLHVRDDLHLSRWMIARYKMVDSWDATRSPSLMGFYFNSAGNVVGGYIRPWFNGVGTQNQRMSVPSSFKKAFFTGAALGWTDYSGGASESMGGTTVTNHVSTNVNFTAVEFPRPPSESRRH